MSRWQIRVPHRSASESLAAAAAHTRDVEDGDVMRQLMLDALGAGDRNAGDLIDRLAGMTPAERRALIDDVRAELGLEPTAAVDERERFEAFQRTRVPAPALVMCAHESCTTSPARLGVAYDPGVKRWHCPNHAHLAGPGDLEPVGSGVRISPSGALVPHDPVADAREQAAAESERRRRDAQDLERGVEAAERAEHERARAEQLQRELAVRP